MNIQTAMLIIITGVNLVCMIVYVCTRWSDTKKKLKKEEIDWKQYTEDLDKMFSRLMEYAMKHFNVTMKSPDIIDGYIAPYGIKYEEKLPVIYINAELARRCPWVIAYECGRYYAVTENDTTQKRAANIGFAIFVKYGMIRCSDKLYTHNYETLALEDALNFFKSMTNDVYFGAHSTEFPMEHSVYYLRHDLSGFYKYL